MAARHLAAVHKADPCSRSRTASASANATAAYDPLPLAAYDFVATGGPGDFAWGAADAAGSVISSAADMALVLASA